MIDDEQTYTLPEDPDRLAHLACFLGAADTAAFAAELLAVLQRVKAQYDDLFSEAPALRSDAGSPVFTGQADDPAPQIGCASRRERVWQHGETQGVARTLKN